jgi:hypothetical protein
VPPQRLTHSNTKRVIFNKDLPNCTQNGLTLKSKRGAIRKAPNKEGEPRRTVKAVNTPRDLPARARKDTPKAAASKAAATSKTAVKPFKLPKAAKVEALEAYKHRHPNIAINPLWGPQYNNIYAIDKFPYLGRQYHVTATLNERERQQAELELESDEELLAN